MKSKTRIALLLAAIMLLSTVMACAQPAASTPAVPQDAQQAPDPQNAESPIRVALVVNQKFGDLGPCDQMLAGLEKARDDFGVEI